MEPMTREEILKEAIKAKYGSVLKFANAVNIPESSIRNIFTRGVDSVNAGTLVTICGALNLDLESLVAGNLSVRPNSLKNNVYTSFVDGLNKVSNIIPSPHTYKIPMIGDIACGKPILAVEDAEETVDVPDFVNADFALRCKGDSMINARIFDGDIVYIRSQPEVEAGQIAAVRIDDEATLKRVYYTPGSGRITLRACNPLYQDMIYEGETLNQIQILGLAVGFYSAIRDEQK